MVKAATENQVTLRRWHRKRLVVVNNGERRFPQSTDEEIDILIFAVDRLDIDVPYECNGRGKGCGL